MIAFTSCGQRRRTKRAPVSVDELAIRPKTRRGHTHVMRSVPPGNPLGLASSMTYPIRELRGREGRINVRPRRVVGLGLLVGEKSAQMPAAATPAVRLICEPASAAKANRSHSVWHRSQAGLVVRRACEKLPQRQPRIVRSGFSALQVAAWRRLVGRRGPGWTPPPSPPLHCCSNCPSWRRAPQKCPLVEAEPRSLENGDWIQMPQRMAPR